MYLCVAFLTNLHCIQMITMPGCTDSMCKECFSGYLTVVVKTLEIKHYNCPVCGLPNMADREAANDMYFTILVAMVCSFDILHDLVTNLSFLIVLHTHKND